jgi:23S rRNA (uracil1939-C5)-methyltransferase
LAEHLMDETIELELTGHAYGGEALGRAPDGRMVFVPYAIPGEKVRVAVSDAHQHWARARLVEVLRPSPHRTTPRCKHFGSCGGCHYQHMSYSAQVEAKAEIVRAQLERLGKFPDPPVTAAIASPSPWNTRNNLRFRLSEEGKLCFVGAGPPAADSSSLALVPIDECHLPAPALDELRSSLDLEAVSGLEGVGLRLGADGRRMIVLHASSPADIELSLDVSASVVWADPGGAQVLAGEGSFLVEVMKRAFRVSALSFFQVHTQLSEVLVRLCLDGLQVNASDVVFDLYAGVGLFSAFIAQAGASVIAVEQSPWACADFEVNLEEFDGIELYEASVEAALPAIPQHPTAVVVDPPRAGLGRQIVQALLDLRPSRLVYVSCDPATLARDGRLLVDGGYSFESVTPIDMFPQTFHIETVSVWRR